MKPTESLLRHLTTEVVRCRITTLQPVAKVSPVFAFQNKTPCIWPDSPMLLTCSSLSLGSRLTHWFRASTIRPVCCSFACVSLTTEELHQCQTHDSWLKGFFWHVNARTFKSLLSTTSAVVGNVWLATTALEPVSNKTAFIEVVPTSIPRIYVDITPAGRAYFDTQWSVIVMTKP